MLYLTTKKHKGNDKKDNFDDVGDDNDVPDDEKTKKHKDNDKNDSFDDLGEDNDLPGNEKTKQHKDCGFEAGGNKQESKTNAKKEVWPIGGNL